MNAPRDQDERPSIPQKIGCRLCMGTARLTELWGGDPEDLNGHAPHGSIIYGTYRCDEGHVTRAAFNPTEGSLQIEEPENC